jgi:hypothetical protein
VDDSFSALATAEGSPLIGVFRVFRIYSNNSLKVPLVKFNIHEYMYLDVYAYLMHNYCIFSALMV